MTIKIGIDLGTTNSLVGIEKKGKIRVLKFGNSTMLPSALYFKNNEIIIGSTALKKGLLSPKNIITSSKTFMGDGQKKWEIENKTFTKTFIKKRINEYFWS